MIVIFTFALLVLLAIGVPVAFSLGASGLLGMVLFMPGDGALEQIPILAYKALDDFVLCAVPLYILMSAILLKGKVGEDLFDLGNKWLRHLPGGLGIATIVACGIFAAITGSSVACAVTVGAIAIPEMLKRGYDRSVVLGAVAGGGTLGILIPPSIPMILYGSITGESIGQLFMSGVLPGVLMTVFFIFIVVYRSRHLKLEKKAPLSERFAALKGSIWGLLLPVIVVGGIYTGAFTPTEAAAVGTVYALFITFVINPFRKGPAGHSHGDGGNVGHDLCHHDRCVPLWLCSHHFAGAPGPYDDGCRSGSEPLGLFHSDQSAPALFGLHP